MSQKGLQEFARVLTVHYLCDAPGANHSPGDSLNMTKVYLIMFRGVHIIGAYSSVEIAGSWIDHFQTIPDMAGEYSIAELLVYDKKPFKACSNGYQVTMGDHCRELPNG